jgi:hypothetical protein
MLLDRPDGKDSRGAGQIAEFATRVVNGEHQVPTAMSRHCRAGRNHILAPPQQLLGYSQTPVADRDRRSASRSGAVNCSGGPHFFSPLS